MSTKLQTIESQKFIVPVINGTLTEIIKEEFDGLEVPYQRVKIPSGGGLVFEIPGEDPDNPNMKKELIGVIVDQHSINAYWGEEYTGQNSPPACSSMDGKQGEGNPGECCQSCRFNQYGTKGKGKACKNMRRIYLLKSEEIFPLFLTLPPTSLKPFTDYLARIVSRGCKSCDVVTKISLKKETNSTGIQYSSTVFGMVEKLNPDEISIMRNYSATLKQTTRKIKITQTDFETDKTDFESMPFLEVDNEDVPF